MSLAPTARFRVAVDARPLAKRHDGISRFLWGMVEALAEDERIDLVLLTNRSPVDIALPARVSLVVDERWSRVPGTVWFSTRFSDLVQAHGCDVMWGTQHVLPPFGALAIPSLLTMHDLVHERFPETMTSYNRWIARAMVLRSLKRASAVACISHFTRSEIIDVYGDQVDESRLQVIHNGIEPLAPEESLRDLPARYLFCVGSLEPRKNLVRVVETLAALRQQDSSIHLVLAGGASWGGSALQQCVSKLGIEEYVHFVGRLTDGQIRSALAGSSAAVMASRYEGFGLPVLEAAGVASCQFLNDIPVLREVAQLVAPWPVHFIDFERPHVAAGHIAQVLNASAPPVDGVPAIRTWREVARAYADLLHELAIGK